MSVNELKALSWKTIINELDLLKKEVIIHWKVVFKKKREIFVALKQTKRKKNWFS